MKKCFTTFLGIIISLATAAQTLISEQYASSVIAVSSEYEPTPGGNYNSSKLIGVYDGYPSCGSLVTSWAPATQNGQREFFVLGFATPQQVNTVRVYQTAGPGAIDTVYLRDAATGIFYKIYERTAVNQAECPGWQSLLLEIQIPTTAYNVDAIRVAINSPLNTNWNEYDAVSIANFSRMSFEWTQNASTVLGFSSEYTSTSWSASKVLGPPNVYPNCGDNAEAWASASAEGMREWLEVKYSFTAHVNRVTIYQTIAPGAVDTVYVRNVGTGAWIKVFERTASATPCPQSSALEINFTETTYDVDAVRVAINSPAVSYWNEIDAITIQSNLPPGAIFTAQSGNWSNTATWSGGTLPTANDTVVITNGHAINLDVNGAAESLLISQGSSLTSNSGNTLTVGPPGGGPQILQAQGALNLVSGNIYVNGRIDFLSGSGFTMSGGNLTVDGNDGTDLGSVANGFNLIQMRSGMSPVSITGGTIIIVDPQYHTAGQAIASGYAFGTGNTVRLGDGVSMTASNNTKGFGGGDQYPNFGQLIIDAATPSNNRHFRNENIVSVLGDFTVTANSRFEPYYDTYVRGKLTNNGTIFTNGYVRVSNDFINNASLVTGTGSTFTVVHNFLNNASGNYNKPSGYTRVGNNMVNNGFLSTNWLYFASEFGASANPQTISGTGTFDIYGIDVYNSHPSGVSLLIPLTIQQLYFDQGKLFLGNNNLTLNINAYGAASTTNYVVINGTGKLIINSVSGASILFPIGTSTTYNPITIVNGSGHNFSAAVKPGFTVPPYNSSVVNREWDITDLTGGAVSADVTFQWNGSDEDPSFNRSICVVGHYSGGAWTPLTPAGPATGTDPYTRSVTGVSTFSPFAIGSNNALPVNLKLFTAIKSNGNVQLKWIASNEINFLKYELERSADGSRFTTFKEVMAKGMLTEQQYESVDNSPLSGINYYRLKQMDKDGTYNYSRIVKVDMGRSITIFIRPNPARREIHVQGCEYIRNMQLLDMSGRLIKEWKHPLKETVELGTNKSGIYQLRINTGKETITQRLVISD